MSNLPALSKFSGVWSTVLGTGSFNGLAWGPGTTTELLDLQGIDDMPDIRSTDTTRDFDHGAWPGNDWLNTRTMQLTLQLLPTPKGTPPAGALDLLMQAVQAAFVWTPIEMPLLLFNSAYQVNCRCRKRAVTHDYIWVEPYLRVVAQFVATDPRIYSASLHSVIVGVSQPGAGGTFPGSFPGSWGGAGSGGSVQVTNAGSFSTRPVFAISGPCSNPTITNASTGKQQTWNITLGATDVLTVDNDARTAMLNGSISRGYTKQPGSTWIEIVPGTNTLQFGAAGSNGSMQISWRDAWM